MVLTSCVTIEIKWKDKKEEPLPVLVENIFPEFPSSYDREGKIVYFYAVSGVFDKVINREGDTQTVILNGDFMVVPEWYWTLIEDFKIDYDYARETLTLALEGDP